jgi:hypothetical protein
LGKQVWELPQPIAAGAVMSGTERRDRPNDSLDRVERHHSLDRDDGDCAPQGCPVECATAPGVIDPLVTAVTDAALNREKLPPGSTAAPFIHRPRF